MAPRTRAAEAAALSNLLLAQQELGRRMDILESTMRSVESCLAKIEAHIMVNAARSEHQQLEILVPLLGLVEVVKIMRDDMGTLQGVIRLGTRDPIQAMQLLPTIDQAA